MGNEEKWNRDLLEILPNKLEKDIPNIKVMKGKVLKDIFLLENGKLQFGFVDQDIVFYENKLDISSLNNSGPIIIHNKKNKDEMVIPKLICELKYNGVSSQNLITYSEYASDIKSIFPECKYWLIMLFKNNCSNDKLKRHGKYFDKIIFFNEGEANEVYEKGSFQKDIRKGGPLKSKFDKFLEELKKNLCENNTVFLK